MGRFSPGCDCCACEYVASDGNEYTDDFTTLDAGWVATDCTPSIVSGKLHLVPGVVKSIHFVARAATVTNSGLLVVVEAAFRDDGAVQTSGIFFGSPTVGFFGGPASSYDFALISRWRGGLTNWVLWSFGVSHAPSPGYGSAPVDGDIGTIKITDAGGTSKRACYFVNGELIYEETASWTFGASEQYGAGVGNVSSEIDDYTIHVGNP